MLEGMVRVQHTGPGNWQESTRGLEVVGTEVWV